MIKTKLNMRAILGETVMWLTVGTTWLLLICAFLIRITE
jgi:hypothetical protein